MDLTDTRDNRHRKTTNQPEARLLGGSWNVSKIVGGLTILALVAWLLNPCACCQGGNWIHPSMAMMTNGSSCTMVEDQCMQPGMQTAVICAQTAVKTHALNSGLNTASQVSPMLPSFATITDGQITYVTPCHLVKKLNSAFMVHIDEPPRV